MSAATVLFPTAFCIATSGSQDILNQQLRNSLIAQYGSIFYSCVSNTPSLYPNGMDQSAYASYLNLVQMKLVYGNSLGCYTKTNDQLCKDNYGVNSIWSGKSNDKGPLCGCVQGFVWNSNATACQTLSGTLCNDKYWGTCPTGFKFFCPPSGDPVCCPEGLTLNKNNHCVTKMQACQDNYGNDSLWNGSLNDTGNVVCGCKQGFTWNPKSTACIAQIQNGTLCNGKYWAACPSDQKFYCPASGDAQCLLGQEGVATIQDQKSIIAKREEDKTSQKAEIQGGKDPAKILENSAASLAQQVEGQTEMNGQERIIYSQAAELGQQTSKIENLGFFDRFFSSVRDFLSKLFKW